MDELLIWQSCSQPVNPSHATINGLAHYCTPGADPGGGPGGPGPPLTTKNEAPAPKFYKTEAPEWQF